MNHLKSMRQTCILVGLLTVLVTRPAGATTPPTTPHPIQCGGWTIVPSVNPTSYLNILNGVAAVSATDAWAVGYDFVSNGALQTLIEHWDGTSWQVVPSPSMESSDLFGMTALSAKNIWAVGYDHDASQTLIEHWDGTQWRIIPSPSVGNYLNSLGSVVALSPSDIWAVGTDVAGSGMPYRTLTEHWDGRQWRIVTSPNVGSYSTSLQGVTALSPTDVWAVGYYASSQQPFVLRPLVEHWDGSQWRLVHAPGPNSSGLAAVTAVTATDVWAVGKIGSGITLTERWNGRGWHIVTSPNPSGGSDGLRGVAAGGASDIWAVGNYLSNQVNLDQTLTEHWNGTQWQIVASPNVEQAAGATLENYLTGVAVVPATQTAWAVGYDQPYEGYTGNTLIEYYC